MRNLVRPLFSIGFALLALLRADPASAQVVIDVQPGGPGIQAAMHAAAALIDAAQPTPPTVTVKLAPGTYYEKVWMGRRLSEMNLVPYSGITLEGNPLDPSTVVIDASNTAGNQYVVGAGGNPFQTPAVMPAARNLVIRGITVKTSTFKQQGISANWVDDMLIEDNVVIQQGATGIAHSMRMDQVHGGRIARNRSSCETFGVARPTAPPLETSSIAISSNNLTTFVAVNPNARAHNEDVTIEQNQTSGCRVGVLVRNLVGGTIQHNVSLGHMRGFEGLALDGVDYSFNHIGNSANPAGEPPQGVIGTQLGTEGAAAIFYSKNTSITHNLFCGNLAEGLVFGTFSLPAPPFGGSPTLTGITATHNVFNGTGQDEIVSAFPDGYAGITEAANVLNPRSNCSFEVGDQSLSRTYGNSGKTATLLHDSDE